MKGFLAGTLIAFHMLVISMAMSPALHHLLHHDADAPDHQCAVTLALAGLLDQPDIVRPATAAPPPRVELHKAAEPRAHFAVLFESPFGGRAPPAA